MVEEEKFLKGHNDCKQLSGGIHENLQILRECINDLYDKTGEEKPEKLVMLNKLFD